jgi:NAD+ synthase
MTANQNGFNRSSLDLDAAQEADRLVAVLQETVLRKMRRQGAVVGISGGIDSWRYAFGRSNLSECSG